MTLASITIKYNIFFVVFLIGFELVSYQFCCRQRICLACESFCAICVLVHPWVLVGSLETMSVSLTFMYVFDVGLVLIILFFTLFSNLREMLFNSIDIALFLLILQNMLVVNSFVNCC
ncbi:hypothetical protein BC941DRAFT_184779 [Chlamydoabsidia padenii]|nr:hypothetical protein BC941DRAFT_184779 [Chlamydoabsidia padenii]